MRRLAGVFALTALILYLSGVAPAYAHWADQSVAEVVIGDSSVRVTVTLPTSLLAIADIDGNGRLTDGELTARRRALAGFFEEHLALADEAGPGTVTVKAIRPSVDGRLAATHSTLELVYSWPRPLLALTIRYDLFPPGVATASCLATIVRNGSVQTFVFTPQNRVLAMGTGWTAFLARLGSFIVLGIEHILTAYDHLLFLLSLLMLGGTLRGLLKIVSAFTVAHSITLSLAALNLISLPGRWVESAIALSIVVVAAENVLRSGITLGQRWAVTFAFGLVHGLGFASILRDLQLPKAALVSSLVGFNLGVELGQIAIVAVAFGTLQVMRRWPQAPAMRRWVSVSAAVIGLIWFVQRAFLG